MKIHTGLAPPLPPHGRDRVVPTCQKASRCRQLHMQHPWASSHIKHASFSKSSPSTLTNLAGWCMPLSRVPVKERKQPRPPLPRFWEAKEPHTSCPSAPVDFLGSMPVSSQQTGTMGHVSSEEGLGILSWRKDVASENWQVHSKAGVKLRITQVTF